MERLLRVVRHRVLRLLEKRGALPAVCHRVIGDHGGTITLHSDEGVGTTVPLVLPAAPAQGPLV